jgi:hypothetical protein
MANMLIVSSRSRSDRWPVYLGNDASRPEGAVITGMGPLVRSVASWQELKDLADEYDVPSHAIDGIGLAEMERELGPMPTDNE